MYILENHGKPERFMENNHFVVLGEFRNGTRLRHIADATLAKVFQWTMLAACLSPFHLANAFTHESADSIFCQLYEVDSFSRWSCCCYCNFPRFAKELVQGWAFRNSETMWNSNLVWGKPGCNNMIVCALDLLRSAKFAPHFPCCVALQLETAGGKVELDNGSCTSWTIWYCTCM